MNESLPQFRGLQDLPAHHLMAPGTPMCAGCGGLEAINQAYDVLGTNTTFVNAAGCMTLLTIYPFTPFRSSWIYAAMASAPAGAQGVRDALDVLIARGRLDASEDRQVVVLTGDGSANGMGLSATSAAIDRGLDFIYLCYDNEGYGNTGHQTSGATPLGARTATDAVALGVRQHKKDLFDIWRAHRPAYVATVCAAEPVDLARKLELAREIKGPRLIIALSPCPTGWGFDPEQSAAIGKLAVETGVWPLKQYVDGNVAHTKRPKKRKPVREYLQLQARFAHLFDDAEGERVIGQIQAEVDDYWARV